MVIIALGLIQLAERPRSAFGPAIVIGLGVVLLVTQLDLVRESVWNYVWPVVLIGVGLTLLARRGHRLPAGTGEDVVRASGIFGGPEIASTSQRFKGGSLTAIFGGVTLDLRGARPAPEGARINATAAFGGIDILVPRGWRVNISGTPIFGGFDDETERSAASPEAPVLDIDAMAIFGGIDVKHER